MKAPKLPPKSEPDFSLPEGYFEQFSDHLNNRIEILEKWKNQTRLNPEALWPVNSGLWLKMEEGIRSRIQQSPSPVWKFNFPSWVLASVSCVLLVIGFWYYYPIRNQDLGDWNQIIAQSSESECAAYLEEDDDWVKGGAVAIPDGVLESVLPEALPLEDGLMEDLELEDLSY